MNVVGTTPSSISKINFIIILPSTSRSYLGLTNDPICERCLEEDQSAIHILCDCEAVAHIRFRHLGQFFLETSDYYDAPIEKVLHFIRGVGLIRG
jgi:hypothetical protein